MFARLRNHFRRASVDGRETRERRKDAGLPSESHEGRRRWFWRVWMSRRQTSSTLPFLSKKQFKKEEKELIEEIQLMTQERNELKDCQITVTEASLNKRPYHRQNPLYEQWKSKEKENMIFVHKLEMDNIYFREKNQEFKKEINFCRNLHSRILMEKNRRKKKLVIMEQELKEVQDYWLIIHQYLVDLNLSGEDEQENTSDLETQEHQVFSETARELGLATAQEESILQNELPPQEPPAEHHPQHPQSSFDESSSV